MLLAQETSSGGSPVDEHLIPSLKDGQKLRRSLIPAPALGTETLRVGMRITVLGGQLNSSLFHSVIIPSFLLK